VRAALRIPVLANGDVRCLAEAAALMEATGESAYPRVVSGLCAVLGLTPALTAPRAALTAVLCCARQ
jgi:tRNA-dihydrouridine synthase